jgi:hypothetical protein
MFQITRDPSSGSFIQGLAKITVMVLSCPSTRSRCYDSIFARGACLYCTVPLYTVQYTHAPPANMLP